MNNGEQALKVYFLGSGTIAVPVLRMLLADSRIDLVGIGTQPDKPSGRRRELTPTPVGRAADQWGRSAERIANVNRPEFLERLAGLRPDIILVVSFGQLLKEPLLALPSVACVNIHGSLLPAYRGAAPITAAIAHGDAETGVSFMQMEKGLDSGPVYRRCRMTLDGCEDAHCLEVELGELAARYVVDTLLGIASGELTAEAQDPAGVTLTRKMKKEDGRMDWSLPAVFLERLVRAMSPWPGASFILECTEKDQSLAISVLKSRVRMDMSGAPGEVLLADKHGWIIGTGEGALEIMELVVPGKKAMTGAAFWNGNKGWLASRVR